ncbi:uncharacterized protein BDZ99DRAFT_464981 [Mytilinidion resinicola]|uniref:CBF1-interacting co-repressor CIR N-terminal domain-containing protein n=1 Tax=Mytilinidion resinicola TaxID=574789 RepID=A0A6A6YH13_9PEZI|nr:uncharacterized protein BDZ99DRAFT_464981 [Mytilinidion resinicola]KAF2808091.1 hypothetical protein BDZ99DRAFT_464981 [Mytilinidion resinicola]
MPLHLLAKKSWNVYNPANVARVRADEAAAAAREEAEEQRMQEADAERRIAILRGVTPPPLLPAPADNLQTGHKRDRSDKAEKRDTDGSGHDRKRRRLRGEDDTDRDIRLAQVTTTPRAKNNQDLEAKGWKPKVAVDAPVVDHRGHISLFPVDEKAEMQRLRKGERNDKAEREKRKKENEHELQNGMPLGGVKAPEKPWYSAAKVLYDGARGDDMLMNMPTKDMWGKEDPRREEREKKRLVTNDPFAVMQKAQAQLKQAERDRRAWTAKREQEITELRAMGERERRREKHGKSKKGHHDQAKLESFSLDKSPKHESWRRDEERSSKHQQHRSRSREDSHKRRSSHRSERRRSRSPVRDRSPESSKLRGHHHGSRKHRDERKSGDKYGRVQH